MSKARRNKVVETPTRNLVYYRIYVNTGSSGVGPGLDSPDDGDDDSPTRAGGGTVLNYLSGRRAPPPTQSRDLASSPEVRARFSPTFSVTFEKKKNSK